MRVGVSHLLTKEYGPGSAAEASDGAGALAQLHSGVWNLVILDINLPDRDGLEVLKDIRAMHPHLPVLVLSSYPPAQFSTRVMKAGASVYLTKESAQSTLLDAVRKTLAGGRYIAPEVAEQLATALLADTSRPPHELLSDREYEVMLRIAGGESLTAIAEALNLSVKTVSTYRTRVIEKTGLKNNAEITLYAVRNNLIH